MKREFLSILFFFPLICFGQVYVTDNPYVSSSNCDYCRIAKVIVTEKETKILLEVTGQKGKNPLVKISNWTVLLPFNTNLNLSELRNFDLNIPEIQSTDASYLSIWRSVAEKKKAMQQEAIKQLGRNFINNLGDNALDTWYNIKSRDKEIFQFWLNFNRVPQGVEEIFIMELVENGFEWSGIRIKNPDTSPKTSWDEISLKVDWEKNGISQIEGIYENTIRDDNSKYRLALKYDKNSQSYSLIYLSGAESKVWKMGDVKAFVYKTASPNIYKLKWYMADKTISEDLYLSFENNLMKIIWTNLNQEHVYLKLYPTSTSAPIGMSSSGTGFALSTNGLVVTNHHVIEGANEITVRGVNGNFTKAYKAKVVLIDKNNDLAIIKIEDGFSGIGKIPFSIKSTNSDVGENVFVLGYPLRAKMGEEIKLTNGIISSKTGFQGDITSYQVSVPIQPGNSGGPLFDKAGNLIGIINAKLRGGENVSYAIKVSYLNNLIDLLPTKPTVNTVNNLSSLTLSEQVKILNKFVYIIETN